MAYEEFKATFCDEKHRFDNASGSVIIGTVFPLKEAENDLDELVTIKGEAEVGELRSGQDYLFHGKWSIYKNKRTGKTEKQFAFQSFVKELPITREAIISYLSQYGEGLGIGRSRATAIWDAFGQQAIVIARTEPDRVYEQLKSVKLRVKKEAIAELASKLSEEAEIENIKLSLVSLFNGRGFPKKLVKQVIDKWGNRAAEIIRKDPYKLMRFPGCGFSRCDSLYLDLKLPRDRLKRQTYCCWSSLDRCNDGSSWHPIEFPETFLRANVSCGNRNLEKALELGRRGKILAELRTIGENCISPDGDKRWFAEYAHARNEEIIAEQLSTAMVEESLWPDCQELELASDHQRETLSIATKQAVGILGGGPGTGKTFTVASLVQLIGKRFGFHNVAIGAPTGKAAVRVTENLALRHIPIQAKTWHSQIAQLESKGLSHFPQKFLISDETSMNDAELMAMILKSRAKGTCILFVGDENQLAPVGVGAPLRDMIAARIPYGELTEIKRNSGGIVEACAAIKAKQPWSVGDNLLLDNQSSPESQIKALLAQIDSATDFGLDRIWDCQPIAAVNQKSPLNRADLNLQLQFHLNKRPGIDGCVFRLGDKLVNTKNNYFTLVESNQMNDIVLTQNNEVYVANGELAEVLEIAGKVMLVKLQSPHRIIKVNLGKTDDESSTGCSFELGYALTCHKSQGSDWSLVLPMLDSSTSANRICDRAWIYTAISRARTKCVLIGTKATADRMCRFSNMHKRKTLLREQILSLRASQLLSEI